MNSATDFVLIEETARIFEWIKKPALKCETNEKFVLPKLN